MAMFASMSAAAQTVAELLPNGTYRYAIIERGKQLGSSTLIVTRDNGAITIEEHASPMESSEKTLRTLDSSTLETRSYSAGTAQNTVAQVIVSGNTATVRDGASTTHVIAVANAPFVVSDLFIGLWFHLSATLHVAQKQKLTVIGLGFAKKVELLTSSPAVATQPPHVRKRDSSISVIDEGAKITLWYDPQTFVLDEFDLPARQLVFARIDMPTR